MKNIKEFLKCKQNILILILDIVISLGLTLKVINNNLSINNFNIWLFLLILIFVTFIFSHFIFKINDIYNFLYKKRYLLSIIVLLIIILGKFNGSSIGMWNDEIQPAQSFEDDTIIGESREIRSDEWLVNTPYVISQEYNDYEYYNNLTRGYNTDVFTTITTPVKDILILTKPFQIGYLLFGEEYGLSFYWYGRIIVLLLVTFEMCMLITNKRKIQSIIGAVIITGSSLINWWYSTNIIDYLISGQLCLLFFNQFLETKDTKKKILFSIFVGLSFCCFALNIYPAWQIPLGYLFLIFAIWIFVKNFEQNKNIKDYLLLIIAIIIIAIFTTRFLLMGKDTIKAIMSTVYPGNRVDYGGSNFYNLFIYPISIFFPITQYSNPCEASGIYSLFPIPMIVSILYLFKTFKSKENDESKEKLLLLLLTSLEILFTLYIVFKMPKFLTTITLFKMTTTSRVIPIIQIISAYIILLLLGKEKFIKENLKTNIFLILCSFILSFIIVYIGQMNQPSYMSINKWIVGTLVLSILLYTFFASTKRRNLIIFCIMSIILGLINLVFINPINIGTDVLHDKSVAKEIRKITKKDKNSEWISLHSITLSNYVIMNGGKSINSTNIYPNIKIWKKIDKDGQYENIYNRYAHIQIELTTSETSFKLVQNDYFILYLNYEDIEKLNIKYIITRDKITIPQEYINKFKNIYEKDGINIYKYIR